jgi:hypothetical protein
MPGRQDVLVIDGTGQDMMDLLLELEERGYDLSETRIELQGGDCWSGEYQLARVGAYVNLYLER